MLSTKFSWNDYFPGTPETTLKSTEYSSGQTPSVASVYVSKCLFNKCTITSGNGGALCCTSATYFFVESSSFLSCKTDSGQGGAIYFYNTNCLQSVLYAVCGNNCFATSTGTFARITIQNNATNKNYFNYTSITRSVDGASIAFCMVYPQYGNNYCPSINISMNKGRRHTGIVNTPSVDSSSVTSSMLYSTFADNSASQDNCIWCNTGGANYEIKYCNILRNTQVSSSHGIIFSRGNLVIKDSCILENTANNIFYQESSSYTITLSNCTVDLTTNNGYLTIQNTVTKGFIHGLNHISTQNCHSEYDSAGTLTAIPCISHSSHSTKKIICHTCHCQAQISAFVSLIWLFMVTFIHPNPSEDFWYDCTSFCV
jgi:hypothetical protein